MLLAVFVAMRGFRNTRLTMQTGKENETMPNLCSSVILRSNNTSRSFIFISKFIYDRKKRFERTLLIVTWLLYPRNILHEDKIRTNCFY